MELSEWKKESDERTVLTEKEEMDVAIKKMGQNGGWLCWMFALAFFPCILNGMNLTAYVFFIDHQPHRCFVPQMQNAGWTFAQINDISTPKNESDLEAGCRYYDWNYSDFAGRTYEDVAHYIQSTEFRPVMKKCPDGYIFANHDSVISQWNLVCERYAYRSHIQAAYAAGKFLGATIFGQIADKSGRNCGFTIASLCYFLSTLLLAFADDYAVFLFIRFLVGLAGTGSYGVAYTLLSEILTGQSKTWICSLFNISYPIGMILLSVVAYKFRHWKTLLTVMSVPTVVLPFYYWLLPESPYWLLAKGRRIDAWKVITRIDSSIAKPDFNSYAKKEWQEAEKKEAITRKAAKFYTELFSIFSNRLLAVRAIVCYFAFFTLTSVYFGLAMNGKNFAVDRYLYTLLSGILEIFSYVLPVPLLAYYGRKSSSIGLFFICGVLLISIVILPKGWSVIILMLALAGRFFISAAYVTVALHTSELFPTSIRNTAIGTSSTMSHLGTLASPYVVDILGAYMWYLPSTVFGILSISTAAALSFLPETKNKPLFNTIDELLTSIS